MRLPAWFVSLLVGLVFLSGGCQPIVPPTAIPAGVRFPTQHAAWVWKSAHSAHAAEAPFNVTIPENGKLEPIKYA